MPAGRRTKRGAKGNLLHTNPWFAVRDRRGYFTVEHHLQQVVVLATVERRDAVMVRVPRPLLGDTTLELPAGSANEAETPIEGAAREFTEETGIRVEAKRLRPYMSLAVMPNRTADRVHVFRVELTPHEYASRGQHDREVAKVELVRLLDVPRLIAKGSLYLALPVAVLGAFLLAPVRRRAAQK
jgi:8-oxo-dGTP pyrophosphatase MutT (NUDIX family)